ncbi:hypothetical protein PPERSA_12568 [Pseudocohnilembus persalinus]|uniref:Uncharacterized protein n=1 Tax=Pseudocohnilembus persalinus TaxID=266149 RepID=A0A0V0QCV2_PSEPJ|nr:hypothetical protein PPERSA_12568 [Pseudocohnilembus persalinus]|eukprot:KRW99892.1 hypothetical protein PPERSA_12568 [Pseudocohnilembus persalinus]
MDKLLQNQEKTNMIFKDQRAIVRKLKDFQNNKDQEILNEIIEISLQNQQNIQDLQVDQYDTEAEIKQILKENHSKKGLQEIEKLKQIHNKEVFELKEHICKQKNDSQNEIINLDKQWQKKYQEQQDLQKKKKEQYQDLQKKVLALSKLVATKKDGDQQVKSIMQPNQQFINEAKNLDHTSALEQKQKLLQKHQNQLSNLKQTQNQEIQKRKAILENAQANQINLLLQQQKEEVNQIDLILADKKEQVDIMFIKQEIKSLENIKNIDKNSNQSRCRVYQLSHQRIEKPYRVEPQFIEQFNLSLRS